MLNTFLFYALMLAVVGTPFFFQIRIQDFPKEASTLSRINSISAKLSAFIILSLYVMSFLSFQGKNSSYSLVGFCSCIFSFFLLYTFRGKAISEIREIKANPKERFERSFRSLMAMSMLYGIYFSVVHYLIPITGMVPAVVVAVAFIVYCTPVFVRVWMPTQKMHPSSIKEDILKIFASANSPVHEVYLIDTDKFKSYNALVCGPKYGIGPFKRSVFITRNLFEIMEPEEVKAVMCHEAAHFKLNHIFKRSMMSFLAMGASMCFVVLPIVFISMLFKLEQGYGTMIIATIATVVAQMLMVFRVIRKQEFEADLEALNIGTTVEAMSSALEKITFQNGGTREKEDGFSRFMFGSAHPSLDERLQAIRTRALPDSSKILPPWKYTLSYASFVLILGFVTVFQYESRETNRSVASVKDEATGQNLPTSENRFEEKTLNDEE